MSQVAIATAYTNPLSQSLDRLVFGAVVTTSGTNLGLEAAVAAGVLGSGRVRKAREAQDGFSAWQARETQDGVQRLAWVHSRSRSSGQVLTIRSAGMSFAAARAQP